MLTVEEAMCVGAGIYGNSVLPALFCCEPKTALKNNVYLERKKEKAMFWLLEIKRFDTVPANNECKYVYCLLFLDSQQNYSYFYHRIQEKLFFKFLIML